ncbi:MAG TPA: GDSL-type esterase/lipase family protein [Bradyrhizobium sp.]|nr:GDSL-type esterase/lipase family protein [Bradyrhizobium sp.]
MRSVSLFMGLTLVVAAGLWAAPPAHAEEAQAQAQAQTQAVCDVSDSLLQSESALPKVAEIVKNGRVLDILVIGSRSSTIGASEDFAYPARLQAALREQLPAAMAVNVSVELQARKSADEVVKDLSALLAAKRPALVIWQTGTVDAMRSIDPDDFRAAVDDGIAAMRSAGADVVLMNLQYSPRTETMISVPPYLDNMRAVAQEHDVPLFDRFAIMRQWNDNGDFDLFNSSHGIELAKRVHDCIGRALSKFVIGAAHPAPQQQN